jgi:hypothetical protein
MARYAELMARAMHEDGRRGSLWPVLLNPVWRFLRGYGLRLGFLDGWRGLTFALVEAGYVRQKYLRLYVMQKNADRGSGSA